MDSLDFPPIQKTPDEHPKDYLGDGCYIRYIGDEYTIFLTTENGVSVQNVVVMDVTVVHQFLKFLTRINHPALTLTKPKHP